LEIHAPDKPVLTVKEAAVHLLIVTVGILIALSLEGIVEYVHHRTIVREARLIMQEEIEANQKDLAQTMARFKLQQDGLVKGIAIFSAWSKGGKPKLEGTDWMINYRTAELKTAGHSTAELTGAFGYMDYREVRRYAAVYDAQDDFMRMQAAALADGISVLGWSEGRDVFASAPAEFSAVADKLRQTLASLTVAAQFGARLQKQYASILAEP
jgi:hypothetical protein